ncbi:unnamed protein product, partial [Heterotrigona itama]
SRFEHLKTSSLALPPATQWGFVEPLSRITKDARLRESHLALSDEAAVPRFDTLAAKLGDPTLNAFTVNLQRLTKTKRTQLKAKAHATLKLRLMRPAMSSVLRWADVHTTEVHLIMSVRTTQ